MIVKAVTRLAKVEWFLLGLSFLFLFLFSQQPSYALQEYYTSPKQRMVIPIAENGINRIAIDKDRILKVIGNEAEYILDGDLVRGDVFITSKITAGNSFFVTLVSEKGVVQDITFKVEVRGEPAYAFLKSRFTKSHRSDDSQIKSQIIASIRDILSGKLKNYRTRRLNINKTINAALSDAQSYTTARAKGKTADVTTLTFPMRVVKINESINKHFRILNIEYSQAAEFNRSDMELFFPKLLAVASRGNNLIIVFKL